MTTTLACAPEGTRPSSIAIEAGSRTRVHPTKPGLTLLDRRVATTYPELVPLASDPLTLEAGEAAKSFTSLERILRHLAEAGVTRSETLTVIGGGTIGDLGGFAAATYLRGIEFVQVPTTLLAMVDSSVGGKTAINLPEGKNLVGAFWAPSSVIIDPEFVSTLDQDDFRSGLGEVLKIAIGLDAELFDFCESQRDTVLARDPDALEVLIARSLQAKIDVVEADFREGSRRKLLNLGHTLGHAIEAATNFAIPHGAAVARGMHFSLRLAVEHGKLSASAAERAQRLLTAFGYPEDPLPVSDPQELATFIRRDKKRSGAEIDFIMPTGIGHSEVVALEVDAIAKSAR